MAISQITSKSITDSTITSDDIATNAVESSMTTQMGGRRNLIINGAMQVAQRGTSTTGVTSTDGYYACDRWRTQTDINTWTISQATDAPDGFNNSFKLACTSGSQVPNADEISIRYHIEGQDLQGLAYGTSSAKSFTVSFWIKCSVTGTYTLSCRNLNSSQERLASFNYTVDVADTWEYKTITFTGDTSYAFENVNTTGLQMFWWFSAASAFKSGAVSNTWQNYSAGNHADSNLADFGANGDSVQITGVQLEVGTVATPFEHRSYGEELSLCSRYFFQIGYPNHPVSVGDRFGAGYMNGSTTFLGTVPVLNQMRASPSWSDSGVQVANASGTTGVSTVVVAASTGSTVNIAISTTGSLTSGDGTNLRFSTTTSYLKFDAEL